MFEAVEIGSRVPKDEYEVQVDALRVELLNAQFDLLSAPFPVVLMLVGDDRQGMNQTLNQLHDWMDARYLQTHVFPRATSEELERPRFWRYWRQLPGRGEMAIYVGGYVLGALADHVLGDLSDGGFGRRIEHVNRFERALVEDGALVLKIWLHVPKKVFKKRIAESEKKPAQSRVQHRDRQIYEHYDEFVARAEDFLRRTHTTEAPWRLVESTDERYRNLTVARMILDALQARMQVEDSAARSPRNHVAPAPNILGTVDLGDSVPYETYRERLEKLQGRLWQLSQQARDAGKTSVLVFEGWDAAGKGGAIRRLTAGMDARDYTVVPIGAPTEEEKARHYLWRFWRRLPRAGRMLIFDRSWYGRVLVERVEGFAHPAEWQRAFAEINDFEEQLVEHGMPVLKFWLHISPEEQLRRFEAREKKPFKKYKMTGEDYRNRARWDDYALAVNDMVGQTSTSLAPWQLVAAEDKRHARLQVLKTVCKGLKRVLD